MKNISKRSNFWWLLCGITVVCGLSSDLTAQELSSAALAQSAREADHTNYETWVERYQQQLLSSRFGDEMSPVKLVLTAIEGDAPMADGRQLSGTISYGCQISTSGIVDYFNHSPLGHKGSCCGQIPEPDIEQLGQMLARLPDDGAQLPPTGRRLVVQVADTDQTLVRVYDRANTPTEVLEILRLTNSGIRSWVPDFEPVSQWTAHERSTHGAFSLSPDEQHIVSSSTGGPFRFWSLDTYKLVEEFESPRFSFQATGLTFSPEGSIAAVEGWHTISLLETQTWQRFRTLEEPIIEDKRNSLSLPQFTPDGRFLLVQSSQPALQIFNTENWELRETLPRLPESALAYFQAEGTSRAIYLSEDETVALWDSQEQRQIAELDYNARIHKVAFSPDKSLIAAATVHQDSGDYWTIFRIRIWDAETGELVHELMPFEQKTCEAVEGLLWSQDGRYILAATKAHHFFTSRGIDVWNVKSGRHRGEFSGPNSGLTGLILLPDGRLIAGCIDGIIRIWDTTKAFDKIIAFENSLSNTEYIQFSKESL